MKLSKNFQQEVFRRQIEECTDMEELKALTKSILQAYYKQKEMLEAEMRRSLGVDIPTKK